MNQRRTAFFISDSTCITAQNLGRALLTQFGDVAVNHQVLRFVHDEDRARRAAELITRTAVNNGIDPLVFSTLTHPAIRDIIKLSRCVFFDLFDAFIGRLEQELGIPSVPAEGHSHGLHDREQYFARMEAVNFTLNHDDGSAVSHLDMADIILIGISRTGKTPTCLDLSLNYGIRAANFPLTEDDLEELKLPKVLALHSAKLFGLSTSPERLQNIRQERLPNSRYASLKQCEFEVRQSEALYKKLAIPFLTTTHMSIEEIAATIVDRARMERAKELPINPFHN